MKCHRPNSCLSFLVQIALTVLYDATSEAGAHITVVCTGGKTRTPPPRDLNLYESTTLFRVGLSTDAPNFPKG